ncbi:hypothetical protein HOY82DRAFT_666381 [Tuber indicum]|nr:hypothetical protein HOY82DRAFT_666381 [Tuber indicum]
MDEKTDRCSLAVELDPHHLAALMSFTFANQHDGSRGLDHPSLPINHGVTDDHGASLRNPTVLDGIAGIALSEEGSPVVAVALQLNSQTQEIHLTIATNQTDKEKLVGHLTAVWGKLQALSNAYAEQRGGNSNLCGRRSPEIPGDVAVPLRVELFRDIYQFCMGREMKRMKKWLERLDSFMRQLVQCRGDADLKGTELNLCCVAVGLFRVLELLTWLHDNPGTQLKDHEWEEMYMGTMWVTENATSALDDGKRCEALAQEIQDRGSGNCFQLRRALKKLTLMSLRVSSLISFAHSPRLRHALQYAFSISIVPEQTRTVKLPESQGQWQAILEAACTERADWQREKAEELLKRFESEEGVYPPHPECGLIQYLGVKRDGPWDDIPPLTYIGVSRPSCSACRNWITAFNGLGGQQFYIGSTSGIWRWPWVVPMGQDSLGKIMARKVSREYLAYQNRKSQAARSSLVRPRSRLSAEERERVFATFRATEQKHGGRREFIQSIISEWRSRKEMEQKQNGKDHLG